MDSTDIQMFLTVARTGNVSTAATALHITQSALSKRLKNLEETLEVELFHRGKGKKGVELTAAGLGFMEMAQRWQGLWQDMRSLKGLRAHKSLNIGVLDSVQSLTVKLTHALYERNPDMRLRLQVRSSAEMYDEIDRRAVDVGFSHLERQIHSVRRKRLFSEPFVALCAGKAASASNGKDVKDAKDAIHPRELDPDKEIFVAWWSPGYLAWHESHWEMHRSRRLSTSSVHLQLAFLGTLGSWGILPYTLARRACEIGPYSLYRLEPAPPPRVCFLLMHKQPRSGVKEALETFNACLDTTLEEEVNWIEPEK